MTKENQIKVVCNKCNSEITVLEEKLRADENNLACLRCPECGENITIDLGITEEEE